MTTKPSINEIEEIVDDILTRGVGTFVDPEDAFRKKLIAKATGTSTEDVVVKFGVDPTRPDIHLGHAVVLRKLRQMQDLGVKVIFLIGDFTAQIGDPTGKNKARPEIEQAAIDANMKTYLEQIDKILSLDEKVFSWIRNSDWFYNISDIAPNLDTKVEMNVVLDGKKATFPVPSGTLAWKAEVFRSTRMQVARLHKENIHDITLRGLLWTLKHITHSRLLGRDMFQERLKNNTELYMHEVMYPVLQGIDSYALALIYGSCDLEVGGTDQTFNMLIGRDIMKANNMKNMQSVLSFELLLGLDGKEKMSKSLDNYIAITDTPNDMFGKVMSVPDSLLSNYYELCTFTPMSEVEKIVVGLEKGKLHPKEVKMDLAQQIVEIYHGKKEGESAREQFVNTFSNKEMPEDIPVVKTKKGALLIDILVSEHIVESKTEFRRLLSAGAIRFVSVVVE
ncbi:MAG: Tyrosine-tRNA ligase [Parcubacteria group bacterium GW2011_GWA2_47_7]|nr:MAG: Tyrosine-tRNA ligase [Parcubacteria group bacterium GW2011_GWA2_47_7]